LPSPSVAVRLELPASPAAVTGIGRREAFLWTAICLLANQAVQLVDTSSFDAFATSLLTQNYIYWLACYVVIYRLHVTDRTARATRLDGSLVLAICVLIFFTSFLPYRFGTGLLASITAGYFLTANGGDRNIRAAGGVLLALSTQLVWGPILFQLFTPELLRADAALVGEVLASLRPDIIWHNTTFLSPDGHAIALIGGCSSFNNVSTAVLACVAIAMLMRTEWVRRDFATLAIACAVMILVNTLRLCLLAWSGEMHAFWHDGAGAQILGIGQTLAVLLIAWRGATPRRHAA
jgi:exosortase/archaeosortase family protein